MKAPPANEPAPSEPTEGVYGRNVELVGGNAARNAIFDRTQPTVRSRLGFVLTGVGRSTYGPTQSHREQLAFAKSEFEDIRQRLRTLVETTIPAFERELITAGAPWVPGGMIP